MHRRSRTLAAQAASPTCWMQTGNRSPPRTSSPGHARTPTVPPSCPSALWAEVGPCKIICMVRYPGQDHRRHLAIMTVSTPALLRGEAPGLRGRPCRQRRRSVLDWHSRKGQNEGLPMRASSTGVLFSLLLVMGFASSANAEEYLKSYPVTGRANVRVHADNAGVHITTSDASKVDFDVKYENWGSDAPK